MAMSRVRIFAAVLIFFCAVASVHAQDDYSKWIFNVGGGIGFPQGDLSSFVNNGGHFVIGGGHNFTRHFGVDTEYMWHDLPINSATKQALQTPGASARQHAWTFNPIIHIRPQAKIGGYIIGGVGWYHRSGETTTPGTAIICDPYWSWWFGCTIGSVDIITGSRSDNAVGGNVGGGVTFRIGEGHAKFYTEVRYHYASYGKVPTEILPLTFGLRW
jgi:hypothetical protein